jgi:hypothetical protein
MGQTSRRPTFFQYSTVALGWLERVGDLPAPSAGQADYLVRLDYRVSGYSVQSLESVSAYTQVMPVTQAVSSPYLQPSLGVVMARQAAANANALPLLRIEVVGQSEAASSFDADRAVPYMLEIALDRFPGVAGESERIAVIARDHLICTATTNYQLGMPWPPSSPWALRQCRLPGGPPFTLVNVPAS